MLAAVTHLRPTADMAERALLPDDPGHALALTRVLFDATPRMFNHHRGLWGYTGIALDGAPLTVQSTGVGGPSAAIVVGELHALGLRRAVRIGRAWGLTDAVRPGELVAGEHRALRRRGEPRPRGRGERAPRRRAARGAGGRPRRRAGLGRPARRPTPAWDALAYDLESAAVLAAGAHAGVRAATLVAIQGPGEDDAVAERLGRAALAAIPAAS